MPAPLTSPRPKRDRPLSTDRIRRFIREKHQQTPNLDDTLGLTVALFLHVLYATVDYYLGGEWVQLYFGLDSPIDTYLKMSPVYVAENVAIDKSHTTRLLFLAEMLFNLQDVAGIDNVYDRMFRGQFESTMAELAAGMLLKQQGKTFSYVRGQNAKKADYDIDLTYDDGRVACMEVKAKLDGLTTYNQDKVLSTLRKARKQLPDDKPGIIFARVPFEWISASSNTFSLSNDQEQLFKRFFGNTEAVVSLLFYTVGMSTVLAGEHAGLTQVAHGVIERENPKTRFPADASWEVFGEGVKEPQNWINLHDLFMETIGHG